MEAEIENILTYLLKTNHLHWIKLYAKSTASWIVIVSDLRTITGILPQGTSKTGILRILCKQ